MTIGSVDSKLKLECPPPPRKGSGPVCFQGVLISESSDGKERLYEATWVRYPIEGDVNRRVRHMTKEEELDAKVSMIFANSAKTDPEIYMNGKRSRKLSFS